MATTVTIERDAGMDTRTVTVSVEQVGSAKAEKWLSKNHANRNIRPWLVKKYADDMRNGHWRFVADPFRLDRDGNLLDGQHRCLAIVDADTPIQAVVVRNLQPADQAVMDTGRARSISDVLRMRGYENASVVGATARIIFLWQIGERVRFWGNMAGSVSPQALLDLLEGDPGISIAAREGERCRKVLHGSASAYAACYWLFARRNAEYAADFFAHLESGANLPVGHPILTARNRLTLLTAERRRAEAYIEVLVRAWNAHREGRKLAKVIIKAEGIPEVL